MRVVVITLGVLAFVAVLVAGAAVVVGIGGRDWAPPSRGDGLVPARVARGTPATQDVPLPVALDLPQWAATTATSTGVPARALQAYAAAEIAQREFTPGCGLSWTTLAAIGRVESDHGRFGAADLDADGVARPPIVGLPLDGSEGVLEIRDTDAGRLDGDTEFDRAVGPMQFIPGTWERFGTDGNGDGVADPQQIDDAARAAAAYLCSEGRDVATGDGWWDGVLAYNRSVEYARLVWAASDRYAGAVPAP
ncbi:MAG TPA: lytic murein transglycosylase [Pseudonocardia sp.]|nr:lytic murein transglycosylase [Pseudonocardia sp.]